MKVSVIGVGKLGSCIAYELAVRGVVDELILVDVVRQLAEGQVYDILQTLAFRGGLKVKVGSYREVEGSDVIVLTAGKPRSPEMKSRLQLTEANARIVYDIGLNLKDHGVDSVFVTLTNPVDIMNYILYKAVGLPRDRFIGSGCQLDSARLRLILSEELSVPVSRIEAYVIGEHGERQVPVFSKAKVNGKPLTLRKELLSRVSNRLRGFALEVIRKKGATVYGPAYHTAELVKSILLDEKRLFCCSVVLAGEYGFSDVSIGVPVLVGRNGIEEILQWKLSREELEIFSEAASFLKNLESSVAASILGKP